MVVVFLLLSGKPTSQLDKCHAAHYTSGAGDRGSGLVEPSGSRGLRSDEAEDGKCAHGVGDTGSTFQAPGRPCEPVTDTAMS